MKTITLEKAFKILESCSALLIEDSQLVHVNLSPLTKEPDNEWLFLSWCNPEDFYEDNYLRFLQEGNEQISVCGSSMFLTDSEGDEIQITVLVPADLEKENELDK